MIINGQFADVISVQAFNPHPKLGGARGGLSVCFYSSPKIRGGGAERRRSVMKL